MKQKIFISAFFISLLFIILLGVGFFFPNELSFKIANLEGNFVKAETLFPEWELLAKNNELGEIYSQKKYEELNTKISKISETKCNLQNEKIVEFCANIFYLKGLVHYQMGKDKKYEKQKILFEGAIAEFTKVMVMTPEESDAYIWSQENIAFLQQKFQETQLKDQKTQSNSEKQDQQQGQGEQKSQQKNESGEKQNKNQDGESQENQEKGKSGESEKNENSSSQTEESRLPKEMQQALEQAQQQLEEGQKGTQKGFNRSQSAADKNTKNYDPFEEMNNDPFFQQFFGNDPFFQNSFDKNNFNKNIENPNEKDW